MLARPMLSPYWDQVGEQFLELQRLQRIPNIQGHPEDLTRHAVLADLYREVLGGNVWLPLAPPRSLSSRGNLASPASGPADDLAEIRAAAASAEAGGEDEGDLAAEPGAGEVAQAARVLG